MIRRTCAVPWTTRKPPRKTTRTTTDIHKDRTHKQQPLKLETKKATTQSHEKLQPTQTQPQKQTETRRHRQERRPRQKVPMSGPEFHRTFTLELHSTPKEREGNERPKREATNGTDRREEREKRNNNEETTKHKTAKESLSQIPRSMSTQATSLGKTARSVAVTGSAPELPPTPSKPPPTVARASWDTINFKSKFS